MSYVSSLANRLLSGRTDSVVRIGAGLDHQAFEVDGAVILRVLKEPTEENVDRLVREAHLLALMTEVSPIPVPEVIAVDAEAGAIALRKVEGCSLLDSPPVDPFSFADQLAGFVDALCATPLHRVESLVDRDARSLESYLAEAGQLFPQVTPVLGLRTRRAVEDFLEAPPPPPASLSSFCHNDLGAEHLIADPSRIRLVGIIDWSDAAITDPAGDLGRILRDFGRETAKRVLNSLSLPLDSGAWDRIVFRGRCSLIEDLAYGLASGQGRYVEGALLNLRDTFDPDRL